MPERQKVPLFGTINIFWVALAVLALVSAVAIGSTYRLVDLISASERSQQTLLQLDRFFSHLKDVEAGARSYALTRDERFLRRYREGIAATHRSIETLRGLARSEPDLAARMAGLEAAGEARMARAADFLRLVSSGPQEDQLNIATSRSSAAMDRLRRAVRSASSAVQQSYLARRDTVRRGAAVASLILALGVGLSLAVLAWVYSARNREIAERRELESQLRLLNSELEQRVMERTTEVEESRRLLDAVVENIPDTVFLKDIGDEFKYVMINRAGEKLTGCDRENVIGHVDHELFPKREAELCLKEDKKVAYSSSQRFVVERALTTDKGKRIVETRKVPLSLDGSKKFVLGIVRDLTEQKQLESQIRGMQRLESVGRLTGGVAHDFNNLLAVIIGSVELLRDQVAEGSEAAALADEAMDAGQRGADLVRRLLAFARKQHLDPSAVDLNVRLPDVVPLLERTLGENVRVRVNSARDLWNARIDPTQVDDALVNLAINARDAMPAGGTLTIETANVALDEDYAAHHVEVEPGEYVMLAVSDSGVGMTPDVVARAFEPFFTTKQEGQGTGLGLSQVFGWVKQSGGHIKIYSELDHGTTVRLYLPRAYDEAAAAGERNDVEPHPTGNETILLVEDNANVRRTVSRQLADLGYAVIESADGESALRQVEAGAAFDMLLTDIVMPGGMTGYELADRVKQLNPGVRVLFTSGYTELAATGIKIARDGPLLSKPYTKAELGRAIRSALEDQEE